MPVEIRTTAGLTLYALFKDSGGVAVAMTADTGIDAGWYAASDAAIAAASLPAGTYSVAILQGNAGAPSATDPEEGVVERFVWDGTNEVPLATVDDVEDTLQIGAAAAVVQRHPQIHELGDLVRLSATFLDATTGLPLDPTTVKLSVKPPAATTTTHTYGSSAIVKDDVGEYHFDQNANVAGNWHYRWFSTGTGQAAEERKFKVNDAEAQ
jgi:hypothetical protein